MSFVISAVFRFDVCQGELGDCWLLAALSSLTLRPGLLEQVMPPLQSFLPGQYSGAFRFRFWQPKGWVEVSIKHTATSIILRPQLK